MTDLRYWWGLRVDPAQDRLPLRRGGKAKTRGHQIIGDREIMVHQARHDTEFLGGTALPVPPEYFSAFARWRRLSLMRIPKTLRESDDVARNAAHPDRLRALISLIEDEQGFALYQAVSAAKMALSR